MQVEPAGAIRKPHLSGYGVWKIATRSQRNAKPATRATRIKPSVERPETRNAGSEITRTNQAREAAARHRRV
jgi:hypothetical protein